MCCRSTLPGQPQLRWPERLARPQGVSDGVCLALVASHGAGPDLLHRGAGLGTSLVSAQRRHGTSGVVLKALQPKFGGSRIIVQTSSWGLNDCSRVSRPLKFAKASAPAGICSPVQPALQSIRHLRVADHPDHGEAVLHAAIQGDWVPEESNRDACPQRCLPPARPLHCPALAASEQMSALSPKKWYLFTQQP